MTAEEAIKELRDASDNEVRYGDTEHHYNEVMKRIEAFDMAIKALEQTRWIPVSERLPEEEGNYLVCYNNGYISVSEWHPNPYEKVCFDIFPSLIVAWMPLPKSYVPDINVGKITESEERNVRYGVYQ